MVPFGGISDWGTTLSEKPNIVPEKFQLISSNCSAVMAVNQRQSIHCKSQFSVLNGSRDRQLSSIRFMRQFNK